jgi:hypothetical protein
MHPLANISSPLPTLSLPTLSLLSLLSLSLLSLSLPTRSLPTLASPPLPHQSSKHCANDRGSSLPCDRRTSAACSSWRWPAATPPVVPCASCTAGRAATTCVFCFVFVCLFVCLFVWLVGWLLLLLLWCVCLFVWLFVCAYVDVDVVCVVMSRWCGDVTRSIVSIPKAYNQRRPVPPPTIYNTCSQHSHNNNTCKKTL